MRIVSSVVVLSALLASPLPLAVAASAAQMSAPNVSDGALLPAAFSCSHNDKLVNGCCVPKVGVPCRRGFHMSAKNACTCVPNAPKTTSGMGSSSGGSGTSGSSTGTQCSHNDHMAANGCCVPNTGSACADGFHQSKEEACTCVPD